jgi:hypothetical protein
MGTKVDVGTNQMVIMVNLEEENITLNKLKQKIINMLYEKEFYDKKDIELIKILFEKKD